MAQKMTGALVCLRSGKGGMRFPYQREENRSPAKAL